MSMDITKLLFSSTAISTKLVLDDTGTSTIPASGAGSRNSVVVTIPHGQVDDNIVVEAFIFEPVSGNSYPLPFSSGNQSVIYTVYHDSTNIYIEGSQGAVVARPDLDFTYFYKVFIP